MRGVLKIALRNILRSRRRSAMTASLIVIGMLLVMVFSGVLNSFKYMMIGTITDSVMGHLQVHGKGYVGAIDNLPLHLNMTGEDTAVVRRALESNPEVEAYSLRLKFGAMLSNFVQTTSVRLTAIDPAMETATCPVLRQRLLVGGGTDGGSGGELLKPGEVIVPQSLAQGLGLKLGDEIVLVATNQDGSVNGAGLRVGGIVEGIMGPSGRDGYLHLDDARGLLRLKENEISEVAVRLSSLERLEEARKSLATALGVETGPDGKPRFELHTWAQLSPFSTIATSVDRLVVTVKIVLVAIVLVSVFNVMMMSVYERVGEIGTMAAMGTLPGRILSLFVTEGIGLAAVSTLIGNVVALLVLKIIDVSDIHFSFGRTKDMVLQVSVDPQELAIVSLMVLAVALLSSLYPAFRAASVDPVDALNQGGR